MQRPLAPGRAWAAGPRAACAKHWSGVPASDLQGQGKTVAGSQPANPRRICSGSYCPHHECGQRPEPEHLHNRCSCACLFVCSRKLLSEKSACSISRADPPSRPAQAAGGGGHLRLWGTHPNRSLRKVSTTSVSDPPKTFASKSPAWRSRFPPPRFLSRWLPSRRGPDVQLRALCAPVSVATPFSVY